MAAPGSTVVLTTAYALINSVDLSAYVKSLSVTIAPDALADDAMGAVAHTKKPGVLTYSFLVEFYQRYDSALVNETIHPLVTGGTVFNAVFKAVSALATNNTLTLTNVMVDGPWDVIAGSFGQLLMAKLKLSPASGFTYTKS